LRILEQLRKDRGLPQIPRTDNGLEFLEEAFTQWAKNDGIAIQYIQPGKPNQNAYIERFSRTLRNERMNMHLSFRLEDVREAAYWWMLEYNEERPHNLLGDLTPAELTITARNCSLELPP
jgi:putative transposase